MTMESRKTIRKWFWVWEFEKEENWLNEMAANGWVPASTRRNRLASPMTFICMKRDWMQSFRRT